MKSSVLFQWNEWTVLITSQKQRISSVGKEEEKSMLTYEKDRIFMAKFVEIQEIK